MLSCAVNLLLTPFGLCVVLRTSIFHDCLWQSFACSKFSHTHDVSFLSRPDSPVFFFSLFSLFLCRPSTVSRTYLFLAELLSAHSDQFPLSLLLAMSQLITVEKSSVRALKREWPQIAMFSESHANITQIRSSVVSVTPVYVITKEK